MSNEDLLLGGDAAPTTAPAPKKRGRPPKAKIVVSVDPASPDGDESATVVAEKLPNGDLNILDVSLVPASTKPTTLQDITAAGEGEKPAEGTLEAFLATLDPEVAKRLAPETDTSKFDELQSVPEADGSVSVELPPVSADYALAIANPNRVRIVGKVRRTYAYQRLLRAGKRL